MVSVVIPTYNAELYLPKLLSMLSKQTLDHELIIIDSQSGDETVNLVKASSAVLITIEKKNFNHGESRNIGLRLSKSDIVIFMTQDALPASPYTLEKLVGAIYSRPDIAIAYGRQIPYPNTGLFGSFARLANYPPESVVKTKAMIPYMGIKTCSCSNSFAAYRRKDLEEIGGFPSDIILGEDVSAAARFILAGKAVSYCAESEVYHSHDYTLLQEFNRYFDIGVFHEQQSHFLKEFTKAESQGFKYVFDEWRYLLGKNKYFLLPNFALRNLLKYVGYYLGKHYNLLPITVNKFLSAHPIFWENFIKAQTH